jgi:hypothetical protein
MKTPKQVLDKIIIGMPNDDRMKNFIIMAMEKYAKLYHETELKKLRVTDVSVSVCDSEWHESNIQHFGECIACGLNVDDF